MWSPPLAPTQPGLSRHLLDSRIDVIEVNSPHPHTKARRGKDDAIDADAAARKVLAGEATAAPKDTIGVVESIRKLSLAKASAVKSRTLALVQLQDVLVTAPAVLREQITAATGRGKASQCAQLRPDLAHIAEPTQAAKAALRSLARRVTALEDEIRTITAQLDQLVGQAAPTLTSRLGIGTSHAAQFLISAGQNADRLGSESAFASSAALSPSRFPPARPTECDCTAEATAKRTAPCT